MEIEIIISSYFIAIILSLLSKKRSMIEHTSIIASAVSLVSAISIALKVSSSGTYYYSNLISIDSLGALVMLTIFLTGFMTSLYSKGYFKEEMSKNIIGFKRVKQYFILLNLFILAMFIAVSANNPIIMWIFIEITTLSTAFLISFYNKPSAIEAAWKYLIANSIGLLLGFLGTLIYLTSVKTLNAEGLISWDILLENAKNLDPALAKIAFVFILIGYGTKVGFFPMHTWKPDAYSKAPTPIVALFAGALLNVAFLAILKFKLITDIAIGKEFTQNLLIVFGILSIAMATLIIFIQKNYKRLLAYSSIEHAGIIALGFGFGGIGIFGAILHMIFNSITKTILFFSVGNIFLKYSSTKIANIQGVASTLPITSKIFMIGVLAVTGILPFGIFFTKIYILSAGIEKHPILTIFALFLFVIVFIGFLRHAVKMLFGEPSHDGKPTEIKSGEISKLTIIPPIALIIILIYLTYAMPTFINSLINSAILNY